MLIAQDTFRRLCKARDMLAEQPLTIKELAREVGISPFHFIRQFEALFGVTPHQFRIQSRLDRAKSLLAAHSVTDVCMEVGFASLGSFSDLFSRRIGVAPSVYKHRSHEESFPGCLTLMATAFRNFQEACAPPAPIEFEHANQADQHHGREPG